MTSAGISYDSPEDQATPSRLTLGDCFVVVAMAVVVSALAIGLMGQFSASLEVAAGISGVVFVAMLAGHVALRRTRSAPDADEIADPWGEETVDVATRDRRPAVPRAAAPTPRAGKTATAKPSAVDTSPLDAPKPLAAKAAASSDDSVALQDLDLGNFRPRSPADLTLRPTSTAAAVATVDVDAGGSIEEMIRRLADDIEAGRKPASPQPTEAKAQATRAAGPAQATVVSGSQPAAELSASGAPQLAPPPLPSTPPSARPSFPPTMIETAPPPSLPANAPPATATAKLAAIADALSDEQLEVCLETINDLEDYRAQHYEVSVRLQLGSGEVLDNDTFIAQTRGTGLLPLLEAVKVSSTKRVAVQMIRRGRTGEFFSTVDGEALADRQFSEDVDTITGGDPKLASRLVLAFTQADVRSLTPAQLFTLASIAALGFRFSLEGIADLDMDFEELAKRGFVFAKLDADVFLNGLPTGTTRVPAADICQHLAQAGLSLIVGKVNDETARAKIMGFGAVLGQGALFGAPRPVRADVLRPGEQRPPAA